jgi:hypothetical protein
MARRIEPALVGVACTVLAAVSLSLVYSDQLWKRVELSAPWFTETLPYTGNRFLHRQALTLAPVESRVPYETSPREADLLGQPYRFYHERGTNGEAVTEESAIKYLQSRAKVQGSTINSKGQGWNWGNFNKFGDDEVRSNFMILAGRFGTQTLFLVAEISGRRFVWKPQPFWQGLTLQRQNPFWRFKHFRYC